MKKNNLFKLSLLAFSVLGVVGCSNVEPVTKEEQIIQENEDIVSHGVQVQRLSSGVDANDHPYQSFTYITTPSTASASTIDVSAAFVGGGSCSSYLTVSHNASTKTITATCLQPFSTLIKIHIQSHYNSSAYADVTVHYTQKFNEGFKGVFSPENDGTFDMLFADYLMNTWESVSSLTTETPIDRSQLFNFLNLDLITQYSSMGIHDEYDVITDLYDFDLTCSSKDQINWDDWFRFMTFDYEWTSGSDYELDQNYYAGILWNVSKFVNNEIGYVFTQSQVFSDPIRGQFDADFMTNVIDNVLTKYPSVYSNMMVDPFDQNVDLTHVPFEDFYNHLVFYFDECCSSRNITVGGETQKFYTIQINIEEMMDPDDGFGTVSIPDYLYEFLTTGNTIQGNGESVTFTLDRSLIKANLVFEGYISPISVYGYTSLNSTSSDLYF